ncbi:glutaredoxin family protein [Cyanobacteria bacterium FACHB-DQ100]|uniref:glutaredoxin family protein n=1 Tax=unclassified Leptolyngbya TaxID=2650499 RepID=UPI0016818C23|nr:glutaredoxin family protein [Leptolyngbya sp. FACHB-17]MBD1822744.1 glutaredoxin family protein [Cyanobacteria bacterium FACHB-DQ100]MBD2082479.1 glutaredoxin family protein [Leptolyngbya sp. FACHB-17]
MKLILYSKPGCHLCEGLQEKLEQIHSFSFELEIRDITTRDDWFQAYQYEIPVLYFEDKMLPRLSPRSTVQQVESMLQKYMSSNA